MYRFLKIVWWIIAALVALELIDLGINAAQTLGYIHSHSWWLELGGRWRIPGNIAAIAAGLVALWRVRDDLKDERRRSDPNRSGQR